MSKVFGVQFYEPTQITKDYYLGYGYTVRIGHISEAENRLDPIVYLHKEGEKLLVYKLKVLFLVVRTLDDAVDDGLGLIAVEEGGTDKVFVEYGEYRLLNAYELDALVNRLINQEDFRIHFVF